MVGYATNQNSMSQNTQKFNCHKINEFGVGLVSLSQGLQHPSQILLFKSLMDKNVPELEEMLEKAEFYSELLQFEAESTIDIEYWIDYLYEFGIEHKIPLYDHMSFFKYHNLDLWIPLFLVLYCVYWAITSLCACCCRKLCCPKPSKVDKEKKE
jgi:hypothetical protein